MGRLASWGGKVKCGGENRIGDCRLEIRHFDLPAALRPALGGLRTGSVRVTVRVNLRLQRGNGSSFAGGLPDNGVVRRVVEIISSCAHSLVGPVYPSLSGCFVVGLDEMVLEMGAICAARQLLRSRTGEVEEGF